VTDCFSEALFAAILFYPPLLSSCSLRLCREGCLGRCPTCGQNRNLGNCACPPAEEPGDPRLAALRKLFDKN